MRFKLKKAGVRELLKSGEMQAICMERARGVQAAAGDGYIAEPRNYPERSGAAVRVDSGDAYYDNLKNNTLLKALR